jgi:HEAT repeat protein
MTNKMSSNLAEALQSDCARSFETVLSERNPDDFEALISIAADKTSSPAQRSTAIFLLGAWGDIKAVDTITSALPGLPDAEKVSALDALGRLGSPAALKAVREFTTAESPNVRKFAVHALARIGSPEALEALAEIQKREPVEYVRKAAERYLHKQ